MDLTRNGGVAVTTVKTFKTFRDGSVETTTTHSRQEVTAATLKFASPAKKDCDVTVFSLVIGNVAVFEHASHHLRNSQQFVNHVLVYFKERENQGGTRRRVNALFRYIGGDLMNNYKFVINNCIMWPDASNIVKFASKRLRSDATFALFVAKHEPEYLVYMTDGLRANYEFMSNVVKIAGMALEYASDALKQDRTLVLAAVQQSGSALQFASEDLQNDRGIVSAAVKQHGWALEYASPGLQADAKVVTAAVTRLGTSLRYASDEMRATPEVALAAVTQTREALAFCGKEFVPDMLQQLVTVRAQLATARAQLTTAQAQLRELGSDGKD